MITARFQQDDARSVTSNAALLYLRDVFQEEVLPKPNPLHFLLGEMGEGGS